MERTCIKSVWASDLRSEGVLGSCIKGPQKEQVFWEITWHFSSRSTKPKYCAKCLIFIVTFNLTLAPWAELGIVNTNFKMKKLSLWISWQRYVRVCLYVYMCVLLRCIHLIGGLGLEYRSVSFQSPWPFHYTTLSWGEDAIEWWLARRQVMLWVVVLCFLQCIFKASPELSCLDRKIHLNIHWLAIFPSVPPLLPSILFFLIN